MILLKKSQQKIRYVSIIMKYLIKVCNYFAFPVVYTIDRRVYFLFK